MFTVLYSFFFLLLLGFDIGNHFCEWSLRYNLPNWPHFSLDVRKYPTLTQQRAFLTAYLTEKQRRLREIRELKANPSAALNSSLPDISHEPNLDDPVEFEAELTQLITEANQFALASHYLWSLWAIIQASTSDIPFGYLEFASARLSDFRRRKDNFFYKKDFEATLEIPVTHGLPSYPLKGSDSLCVLHCQSHPITPPLLSNPSTPRLSNPTLHSTPLPSHPLPLPSICSLVDKFDSLGFFAMFAMLINHFDLALPCLVFSVIR